mmetsp:Transcript_20184/g.31556  ORF Transcript_20184/g.31556 Transcript_20184/m.31556 type:complete len:182 (-) Transcript_20184:659-1204(-)
MVRSGQSYDDKNIEVAPAPTEEEKEEASKVDILEVQNVMGSTAGAGSGDFHQYRSARRKEMFRIQRIEKKAQEQEEIAAFEKKKRERADEVEQQRQKRAEKRRKKKDKKKGKGGGGGSNQPNQSQGGQADDDDDDDDDEPNKQGAIGPALGPQHEVYVNGSIEQANAKVKEVQNVRIIDED